MILLVKRNYAGNYYYYYYYFFFLRHAIRFSFDKFFIVVCFCYAAYFSWQLSCTNTCLFNTVISRIFATQPRQESLQQSRIKSFLQRSRASICPCTETMPTFIFAMKQYLHRSHANVHLCHFNTSFMPTFIFVIKLPRHFICIEVTSTLHPY